MRFQFTDEIIIIKRAIEFFLFWSCWRNQWKEFSFSTRMRIFLGIWAAGVNDAPTCCAQSVGTFFLSLLLADSIRISDVQRLIKKPPCMKWNQFFFIFGWLWNATKKGKRTTHATTQPLFITHREYQQSNFLFGVLALIWLRILGIRLDLNRCRDF